MTDNLRTAFESYLVEDVILTLGNLRGSLDWMETERGSDPARRRAGIARLDRQIGVLEDRARDVCRLLRDAGFDATEAYPDREEAPAGPMAPDSVTDPPAIAPEPTADRAPSGSDTGAAAEPAPEAAALPLLLEPSQLEVDVPILDVIPEDQDAITSAPGPGPGPETSSAEEISIQTAILDALSGDDDYVTMPVFRSKRG